MPLAQGIPSPPTPKVLPPTPILIENPGYFYGLKNYCIVIIYFNYSLHAMETEVAKSLVSQLILENKFTINMIISKNIAPERCMLPFVLFPRTKNVHLVQSLQARALCYPTAAKTTSKYNYTIGY